MALRRLCHLGVSGVGGAATMRPIRLLLQPVVRPARGVATAPGALRGRCGTIDAGPLGRACAVPPAIRRAFSTGSTAQTYARPLQWLHWTMGGGVIACLGLTWAAKDAKVCMHACPPILPERVGAASRGPCLLTACLGVACVPGVCCSPR